MKKIVNILAEIKANLLAFTSLYFLVCDIASISVYFRLGSSSQIIVTPTFSGYTPSATLKYSVLTIPIEKSWINSCRRGEGEEGKMGKEVGMRKSKSREGRGCGRNVTKGNNKTDCQVKILTNWHCS